MQEASAVEAEAIAAIVGYLRQRPGTLEVQDVRTDPFFRTVDVDLLWTWRGTSGEDHTTQLEVKADRWHQTGNFFFETQSNRDKGTPGCFLYTEADYLLYYFVTPRTLYALPMLATREWFLANQERFAERATSTPVGLGEHYVTVGRLVPVAEVLSSVPGVLERQI
jgi:hypothetical protein